MHGDRGAGATLAIRDTRRGPACGGHLLIAITAYTLAGDREKRLAAGMDDFFSKPYTVPDVGVKLSRWLPQHRLLRINELSTAART